MTSPRGLLIETFQVTGTPRLTDIALAEEVARDSMERLKSLTIKRLEGSNSEHPFEYSRYQHLALYPELRELNVEDPSIVLRRNAQRRAAHPERDAPRKLESQEPHHERPPSNPSAIDLVIHFPNVTQLDLTDSRTLSGLRPLLDGMPNPERLIYLAFCNLFITDEFVPVGTALGRFGNLRSLCLTHEETFTDEVFDILTGLPLMTVFFECDDLSVDLLQDLVERSEALDSLQLHLPFLSDAEAGDNIDNRKLPTWTKKNFITKDLESF